MEKVPLISQRDIMLVPFPFSDQSGKKVRPVIVISNKEFNNHSEDLVVCGLTSNISKDKYAVRLSKNDLEEGKLFSQCSIKCENILKIDRELIIKKIGKINKKKFQDTITIINEIINPS